MLAEPEPTSFDLRWRMLGTDIRVHPMFWLVTAVLGWNWQELGFVYLCLWVLCVFVSILVHEFGHVLMGRVFGTRGHIVLAGLFGLAIGSNVLRVRWQRVLVSFAGPGAQLILFGFVWLAESILLPSVPLEWFKPVAIILAMLHLINLFWPIVNLLPIWPLDGGMITREICEAVWRSRGVRISLIISASVASVLALHVLMCANGRPLIPYIPKSKDMFLAFFFALFAITSIQALQLESQRPRYRDDEDDRLPWEREDKQPWEREERQPWER
jgi:stage IV sporulation protein FB